MIEDREKYIEQWWRKYEAMGDLDAEFPPAREVFFELINSAHRARLKEGNTAAQMAEEEANLPIELRHANDR